MSKQMQIEDVDQKVWQKAWIWTLPFDLMLNVSVKASIQQSCHVWHWCDIFAKVGSKLLAGYSDSLWKEKKYGDHIKVNAHWSKKKKQVEK